MPRRYVEYLMPVLVEVDVANREIYSVTSFPAYIKPTTAVFEEDRTTQIPVNSIERQQAIDLAEELEWPAWEDE